MLSELKKILDAAGVPYAETFHLHQPVGTYLAWGDEIDADGDDYHASLWTHNLTIELYEPGPETDEAAHERLQAALDAASIPWHKAPRVWLIDLQVFSTTYTFQIIERR